MKKNESQREGYSCLFELPANQLEGWASQDQTTMQITSAAKRQAYLKKKIIINEKKILKNIDEKYIE